MLIDSASAHSLYGFVTDDAAGTALQTVIRFNGKFVMLKKVLLASALSVALLGASATSVMAAPAAKTPTIAVINLPLIMTEIPQAKDVEKTLAKEFSKREQDLQKLQQKGTQLGQDINAGKYKGNELVNKQREIAQLQAEFQLKARALQEDQQKRIQEENRKLAVAVQKAIDAIAQERNIDLVLRGEGIAYTIDSLDISSDVIKRVSDAAKKKK